MLEACEPARRFEQCHVRLDVGMHIGERIDQRVAHARLRRQVHDALDVGVRRDQAGEAAAVGEIEVMEAKALGAFEDGAAGVLEGDVVIVVEAVDPDHAAAAAEDGAADVEADEAGGAGDQNRQRIFSSCRDTVSCRGPVFRTAVAPAACAASRTPWAGPPV